MKIKTTEKKSIERLEEVEEIYQKVEQKSKARMKTSELSKGQSSKIIDPEREKKQGYSKQEFWFAWL